MRKRGRLRAFGGRNCQDGDIGGKQRRLLKSSLIIGGGSHVSIRLESMCLGVVVEVR